ncbi:TetR/AcrR family transcriptional regulator [Gracilibacillus marinus]|uniref:TetR/AcrR family transcriptional regulator n=1 Tax=Gracilibacillus marinus TaxID=630535 RepID=A0ABV8VZN4_9BACI
MNDRKRKVADIALNLFIEKGFQQTSIQEIIEKSNISKGTFYNYFTSKHDCIAEILENIRYDANQQRVAMQIGKDPKDRSILIDQITILMQLNDEKNVRPLFENILYSKQSDLKKLVLQHRVIEMEWLSNRLVDIFGEEIKAYAQEATVLFYGMLQYMLFTLNLTRIHFTLREVVETIFTYVEHLIPYMQEKGTTFLNDFAIDALQQNMYKNTVTKKELLVLANGFKEQEMLNEEQRDLLDVIISELERERIRKIIIEKLLQPLFHAFETTTLSNQMQRFVNLVWNYLKENN